MIESASINDIFAISAFNRIFRKAPEVPIKFDDSEWIKERIGNFRVIRDHQGIAAVSCVTMHDGFAKLDILAVREDLRGKGFGKRLIQHAMRLTKDAGLSELRVGSAKRFDKREYYLRQGFRIDAERTNEGNDEFVLNL